MIRSGLIFSAGAAAGVYGMVKVRRIAEAMTPDGMRDRIGAAVLGARMLREEVTQGQADAELRLRERYRALQTGAGPRAGQRGLTAPTTTPTAGPAALNPPDEDGHA